MLILHQLATLSAFLLILFSPCASAYRVMLTWDYLDAAYLRFESTVAELLSAIPGATVEPNLVIRPLKLARIPAWSTPPDRPHVQPIPVVAVPEETIVLPWPIAA